MRRLRNRRILFILPISAILLSLFAPFAGSQPAKQAMIVPNAVLSGRIQWVEDLPSRSRGFAYAILYIDSAPRSVNNALPLRFDLDTTRLEDGRHTIKVEFFDNNEKYAETPPTPVIVANHAPVTVRPPVVAPSKPLSPVIIAKSPAPVTVHPQVAHPLRPSAPVSKTSPKPNLPVSPVKSVRILMGPNPLPKASSRPKPPVAVKPALVLMGPNPLPKPISVERPLQIYIGGQSAVDDLAPFLLRDRTMALLRPLTAVVGGRLEWNGSSGMAAFQSHKIRFSLNSARVQIDGRTIELARPLLRRQGRIFAPLSLWQVLFSGTIRYDAIARRIDLDGIGISRLLAK